MEDVGGRAHQPRPSVPVRTPTAAARVAEQSPNPPRQRTKKGALVVVLIIGLVLAGLAVWFFARPRSDSSSFVDSNAYQAVHIIDGQLYFGKITEINNEVIKLTDVYYFPPQQNQSQDQEQQQLKLNKLGSEIHGPQDAIYFNRRNVIFWENLKDDSKLVQTIKQSTN